ncbi:cell division protein SepF [Epidermidibacterium keratini]|uniref:Cell division protein SepF n=1 Tax=Epidermidibacterium keratini TaxID=1891644 RepID=A0A7L4YI24_9ACTN|nr:cell division protein SepF [Epidermidibacterium keratini]QHB99134.1 cell division protein SepF [Epidermidibacterium keratini]
MAGAMRKMGIYLGLVEDDERAGVADDYPERTQTARGRDYDRARREDYDDEYDADYDSADYDGVDYDDEYDEAPARKPAPARSTTTRRTVEAAGPAAQTAAARWSASEGSDGYRITTLHPRTYPEARTIGEQLRDGTPVIINLSEMDDADAKRLVDFAAGLTFGLRGSIERVTNKVFLLSPQKVTVTAEDRARIAEGGYLAAR